MTYRDIIEDNCVDHSNVEWWPQYAYHFTDVENAVEILLRGIIYSRQNARRLGVMKNDNASRQVIDVTNSKVLDEVRLYFRPKTPTQYHNEGLKHPELRYDGDVNANVPVPIFFLFDLESILLRDDVFFSEKSQAGYRIPILSGIEDFASLNFDKIYEDGYMDNPQEDKQYRHAEIMIDNQFAIDENLVKICCRNECEKITLLNLLRKSDREAYSKYKDIITVCKSDMFEYNGLFVEDCHYYNGSCSVSFSNTWQKDKYIHTYGTRNLRRLDVLIELSWERHGEIINRNEFYSEVNYEDTESIQIKGIVPPKGARSLYITIRVLGKLMCLMSYDLYGAVLF